jgi:hypothetical protein
MLSEQFDDVRIFIRNDQGDQAARVFAKSKPIIAQEIITGEHRLYGHVLTVEGKPQDRTIEVQLALFNSIPYRIPMTHEYSGDPFAKGHYFSLVNGEASELRVTYVAPDFDPSTITW